MLVRRVRCEVGCSRVWCVCVCEAVDVLSAAVAAAVGGGVGEWGAKRAVTRMLVMSQTVKMDVDSVLF